MSTELITVGIWKQVTRAANKLRRASLVAVAYFGKGASKLLPLKPRSRLVVDASELAVKSGQTCPAELLKLQKLGVRIFSVPNLHAKLFVFGSRAYIGSTNASNRSANTLIEAIIATTEPEAVQAARRFIKDLCIHELGEEALKALDKIYRMLRIAGNKRQKRKSARDIVKAELPKLRIQQLDLGYPPEGSEETEAAGERAARRKRTKPRTHVLDEIWWSGNPPFAVGDTILQVVTEDNGRVYVAPAGNVIHTRKWRRGNKRATFTFLEVPNRRRKLRDRLAKQLGYGAKKQLMQNGRVRNANLVEKLLAAWG